MSWGDTTTAFEGPPGSYDLVEHAHLMAARIDRPNRSSSQSYVPAATPLMMSGVGDRTAHFLSALLEPLGLEPLQTGGGQGTIANAPEHYVDGGALGVELIRGDVSSMALGTVTHVEGRKLCGFGHPMMNAGNSSLPTSIGRVLWINASGRKRSFARNDGARSSEFRHHRRDADPADFSGLARDYGSGWVAEAVLAHAGRGREVSKPQLHGGRARFGSRSLCQRAT
jgi:hypothetical protein